MLLCSCFGELTGAVGVRAAMEIVRQACEDSRRRREEKRKAKIRRKLEWEQQGTR